MRFLSIIPVILFVGSCGHAVPPAVSSAPAKVSSVPVAVATAPASNFDATTGSDPFATSTYTLAGLRDANAHMANGTDKAVVVSFFSNGRTKVVQHCYVFADGSMGMIRFVEDWAIQGGGKSGPAPGASMPVSQRLALDAATGRLPASQTLSNDADAFFVSWNSGGKRITRTYDRTKLSLEVLDFCDLVDIPRTWL